MTFDIDANGILNVSAKDLGTGKEQAITITAPNKLSEEEIKQKIEEAKKHAEEDRRKQEEIEIRNNADSMIYTAEKTLDELGDKVPAEKKEEVEKQVRELRELIAGDDIQAIKSKTEELTKTVQEIGAVIYQQAAQQQAAQQQAGSTASEGEDRGGDDTIDADFEVKN